MNENPIKLARYRGEMLYVDTSNMRLSDPPQYPIQYQDGRTEFAPCDEIKIIGEYVLNVTSLEEAVTTRVVPRTVILQEENAALKQQVQDLYAALNASKQERERLYQSNQRLRAKYGELED